MSGLPPAGAIEISRYELMNGARRWRLTIRNGRDEIVYVSEPHLSSEEARAKARAYVRLHGVSGSAS